MAKLTKANKEQFLNIQAIYHKMIAASIGENRAEFEALVKEMKKACMVK